MACFVANDALAKLASDDLPLGQILVVRNAYICCVVLVICWAMGLLGRVKDLFIAPVGWRTLGELVSTPLYLLALFNMPIANVTAILQMLPIAVMVAAFVFFSERVGPRRWTAAVIGLVGVLLIVRPGFADFNPWALSVVAAVAFITMRDVATRLIPAEIPTILIAGSTSVVIMLLGAGMMAFGEWQPMDGRLVLLLLGSGTFLLVAYSAITIAMRTGELSLVGLFRYSIVLWAVLLGYVIWGEWPDPLALTGSALVVATGAYTIYRERKVKSVDG